MPGMKTGVAGVSWQVHAGGFYEMSKYTLAPAELPDHLVWHKWQSYWTWISGFSLLCWVYYGRSSVFLIDPAVAPLGPLAGGGDRRRVAGARLDRLRSAVQVAAGQERRAAGAGRLRLRRADELRLHAGLLRARRADPHRRADGDDDDRQRLPGHHAQPAQVGRGADRRPRRPIRNGRRPPSSVRPTTTTSRCPSCS